MPTPDTALPDGGPQSKEQQAALQALQDLLLPLGRLLVDRGMHHGEVDERLKVAMIQAAREAALKATPGALPHRLVSRIAASTGINRREVTRLVQSELPQRPQRQSLALRLFARWNNSPEWQGADGQPLTLPRQGAGKSFESLAALVSTDVHARSVLDDLVRLKLVDWQTDTDLISIKRQAFVPDEDQVQLLGYLGANVGDHLSAAVDNVGDHRPRHFEQAINAVGLSAEAVGEVHDLVAVQWKRLVDTLVPQLQTRIDAAEAQGEPGKQRLRIGFFMYSAPRSQDADPQQETNDE